MAGPSGAVLDRKGPAERCLRWRVPVQRSLSTRRALFSGAYLHGGALFSSALPHGGPCSAVLFRTVGPVQRCSSARRALFSGALPHGGPCSAVLFRTAGPVQRCSSARRALFSGAYLHGGALFSGALLHGGPCSAVLFCTAGPVQRCSSARRALFSGALLHGGPCSAVPIFTAGPCSAVLFCTAGPVQRCSSARRALFSGAHPVSQGSQTWAGLPAQSPSDRDVSGPFGDGVLGPWVSSLTAGTWHVGPTCSALLLPDFSALLPFRSLDVALGPLPPLDVVAGEVGELCSLGAAVSVLSRRPLCFLVLFPGGGAGCVLAAD
ncbi:hypothetical protein NDU88_004893 [Pleurodeles waltl]|uniref:Uncharacterized protein n=1 Tax=Pleurodeles waltl TaxID=8319 RepID=A0AAV7TAF1_PLEWA|nr:hypothetical protein NDU88_004893 [Pleurodeles waltl]